jgi:hypothetical protein
VTCLREQSSLCIYPVCGRDPARCFAPNPAADPQQKTDPIERGDDPGRDE